MPTQSKAGRMRHVVNVMRPPPQQGDSPQKTPEVFRNGVPCSIDPMSGREIERMNQMGAIASHKVVMYGDPKKQIKRVDWLIDETGKRLNIVDKADPSRCDIGEITLFCMEEAA